MNPTRKKKKTINKFSSGVLSSKYAYTQKSIVLNLVRIQELDNTLGNSVWNNGLDYEVTKPVGKRVRFKKQFRFTASEHPKQSPYREELEFVPKPSDAGLG